MKKALDGRISPPALTPDTLGHSCPVDLLVHPGAEAQVFLERMPGPLFFSQVRDAIR